jgi:hypothetical protein
MLSAKQVSRLSRTRRTISEKRPVVDAAKAAYHGYQLAEQLAGLRHGWGRIKAALFEFFVFAAAAAVVLVAGRFL